MGCRGRGCSCGQSKPYFSHLVRQAVTCWQPRVRASLGLRVRAAASDPCPGRAAAAGARRSSSRHGCLVARRALATTWSPGRRPGRWVAACQRFLAGPGQSAGRQGRRRLCAASCRSDRARMVRAPSQAAGRPSHCRMAAAGAVVSARRMTAAADGRAPQGHPLRQRPPAWPCGRGYGRSPLRRRHGRQCEPRRSESPEPWRLRSACCCRAAANSRPLILRHHCSRPDTVHGARAADRTQPGGLEEQRALRRRLFLVSCALPRLGRPLKAQTSNWLANKLSQPRMMRKKYCQQKKMREAVIQSSYCESSPSRNKGKRGLKLSSAWLH